MSERKAGASRLLRQAWSRITFRHLAGERRTRTLEQTFREGLVRYGPILTEALRGSRDSLDLLRRLSRGGSLSAGETDRLLKQLLSLARIVPVLGLLAAPRSAILLPLLARSLPWDRLLPRSGPSQRPSEE